MSTVRYYRWDDTGAPSLTGEVGSLTNLLRKCLVGASGVAYGSKPSAGWTEEFVGAAANIAVFKNNESEGGCGCFVRVDDNAVGGGGAQAAQIVVYAAMSDVNTGILGTEATWFRKSSAPTTTARDWLVIADGRTAWLFVLHTGDGYSDLGWDCYLHGFGDFDGLLPSGSAHRYFVIGGSEENSTTGGRYAFTGNRGLSKSFQMADPSGIGSPVQVSPTFAISGTAIFGGKANPTSTLGAVVVQKIPPATSSSNVYFGVPRGLYVPFSDLTTVDPGTLADDSDRLVVVHGNNGGFGSSDYKFSLLIDAVGPW